MSINQSLDEEFNFSYLSHLSAFPLVFFFTSIDLSKSFILTVCTMT